ncbi:hypothetical protein OG321_39025 [Streptomyces sp. NBC_00424]|uniref:hypothetical protein n=1 Tax=Streptomyces sp. NBC_00424 TaxID=2903648 RepID=UPI0022540FA8|nr:hypothetical protein [Streptomyces sp. NBC_00424]MCX5078439.1 hypothetical protein [Streptomyces sp. NBC_00424]
MVKAVDAYDSLDEFRDQFRFLDLDGFMRSHGLVTVEDLRESGEYLRTEVKLRLPPVFDPGHPANRRTVAVVVGATDDVAGAVRAARLVAAAARDRPLPPGSFGVRVAPYALVAAFPSPVPLPPSAEPGLTQAQIESLLEGAGMAAVPRRPSPFRKEAGPMPDSPVRYVRVKTEGVPLTPTAPPSTRTTCIRGLLANELPDARRHRHPGLRARLGAAGRPTRPTGCG